MIDRQEIAAIGHDDQVYLFNAIGVKTIVLTKKEEVDKAIYQLVTQKYKIIFVSETLYQKIPETLEMYKGVAFPIIIPIPIDVTSSQLGEAKIRDNVEKAIGIDIF